MNDLQASELISRSLSGELSPLEQQELAQHLARTPQSQSLAHLSTLIQNSLQEVRHIADGDLVSDAAADERLSSVSKERMRRSIRAASRAEDNQRPTSQLQVAQTETTYYRSDTTAPVDDSRQADMRFTLLRKIGEGGLGTVWLARDEKLKRNVALKELNSQAADSQKSWQRFTREAEITGHLEHPNVVPLYVSGVNHQTGLPFYAMRFLGKQTLADAIRELHSRRSGAADDPIHLHRLLNAFLDVCQAIAFAHARGVIHRDLKPENVALDNFGQVLVLDWGLAKVDSDGELATRLSLAGSLPSDSIDQTLDGEVLGTPLYMAPEQAAGDLSQLDERTDVYGLGAILFAILTGIAPHENSYRAATGKSRLREVLQRIATSDTPRPRNSNPAIPRDLESICMRAMSKERYARHASAQELASEVESWIAGRHRLQTHYEALRQTGRDLKSRLCVQIRQLAVTAQFMVELPPIRGLQELTLSTQPQSSSDSTFRDNSTDGESGTNSSTGNSATGNSITTNAADLDGAALCGQEPSQFAVWKERLSTVLRALAKTNPALHALSYARLHEDRISELVRIERSQHDAANIRALPQSRLRHSAANIFHKTTMEQFPGECYIDIDLSVVGLIRFVAGVPVFDPQTEEPFGLVWVEAETRRLVGTEMDVMHSNHTVYLIDDSGHILYTNKLPLQQETALAANEISRWSEIEQTLSENAEYTEPDQEYYATRLTSPYSNCSLRIVLQVSN